MPDRAPVPSVIAMLICDQVITEVGTNKKSLIGIFQDFNSPRFPSAIPRLAVYARLADAFGKYDFKIRLVKLKDESVVAEIKIGGDVQKAGSYTDLALNVTNFPIPAEGKYEFQLYANDVYLHRVTMNAKQIGAVGGTQPWQRQ